MLARALILLLSTSFIASAQEPALDTQEQQFSYALGVQFGPQILFQLQNFQISVDEVAMAVGVVDVLSRSDFKLTEEQMQAVMTAVQQEVQDRENEMREASQKMGDEYRADYAKQEGVDSTANGVLYKVITAGDGAKPNLESTVTVHYRGTLIDGTEFDSSYNRDTPTTFPLGSIIPGWQEVLQLMGKGSKWEVVIPPQLAYGENGAPPAIPPNATLVFEIELLEIQ